MSQTHLKCVQYGYITFFILNQKMTAKAITKNGMAQLAGVVLGLQAQGIAPSDIKEWYPLCHHKELQ